MEKVTIECEVLCVGGGIAGLMAAIRASELGARVVVAEKGNVMYSGCGRAGNDHFETYIPHIHGSNKEHFIDELLKTAKGEILLGKDIFRVQFEKAYDIVRMWDKWGIPMKYKGEWEFAGHAFPGQTMTHIKYQGRFQKRILVDQAKQRGVNIINRVMVIDLLSKLGVITGAIGMHTREDKMYNFRAKSVLLSTGKCSRLYPSLTPGWLFNDPHGGTQTGDGRAMAYRAGAELQNVEMPQRHIGPKYFTKFGQATWVGVLRDADGKPVGPFVKKPERNYGDMIMEVNKSVAREYTQSGKGPVYMDCRGISEEDYRYMRHWLEHEGNISLLDHMKDEGIDVRKHPVEFSTYPLRAGGLIVANEKTETNLKGLYAAGDEAFGDISAAATFGWIGGESSVSYSRKVNCDQSVTDEDRAKINSWNQFIDRVRGRQNGPDWEEVNIALQQVMNDYAGSVRNEALLNQGLSHLQRLKQKTLDTALAKNSHEMGRCLEVLNMLDLGELVFILAKDRRETRELHNRPDYPQPSPEMNGAHIIKLKQGKPAIYWRDYQGG